MRPNLGKSLAAVLLIASCALGAGPARAQPPAVDVALVLAADVSRSIDEGEFKLQREGYASAIMNPRILKAIRAGAHGAVALCFIEWAGPTEEAVVVEWTVIADEESAAGFADTLLKAPRSFSGRTAIGDGIDFAVAVLASAGLQADRRVIDVSGDGNSNAGRLVLEARDEAVAKGITINGLAIINEVTGGEPGSFFYGHTHPPGGLPNYYRDNVIGGAGAFVMQVVNFDTFSEAITNKLLTEISALTPKNAVTAQAARN
jgi:hypothetical protein